MNAALKRFGVFCFATVLACAFVARVFGWPSAAWLAAALFAARATLEIVRKNQLERWLSASSRPALSDGWPEDYDSLYQYIKQREQNLSSLAADVANQRALFDALPDSVVVLDERLRIAHANQAAVRLLGLRLPDDHGMPIVQVLRDSAFAQWLNQPKQEAALAAASPKFPEQQLEHHLLPGPGAQRLLLSRDVTARQRLETIRRDFVANVSHELKTPLTVVAGFAETLLNLNLSDTQQRRYLQLIDTQAANMRRLVDDLLMLAKLESTPLAAEESPVAIAALMESLELEARGLSAGRHRFEFSCAATDLKGNTEELRSAFLNLISNAIRYTPDGGLVRVDWRTDGEGASFCVADTGIGIAPEHLPRLTERFYRVDRGRSRASGGTGLGLAIVKHVLMRHDARMQIDSEPGRGSTFTVRFPAGRVYAAAPPQLASTGSAG